MPSAIDMSVKFRDPSFVRTTARGGEGKGPEDQCHPKLIMSVNIREPSFLILTPEKFIFLRDTALEGQNYFRNDIEQYRGRAKRMFD